MESYLRRLTFATFFILLAFVLIFVLISTSCAGESEKVTVKGIDGDLVIHPGQDALYRFRIQNNATVSDRYLIEISLEYSWDCEVRSIVFEANGEPVSFSFSETGVMTTQGLPDRKTLLVDILIHVPMLCGDDDWNRQNGLISGTYCTISLWVSSMSDNYISKGTDQFEARMLAHHSAALETTPDIREITTIGEENERIATYALRVVYLSNDGEGDNVFLTIVHGISQLWGVSLENLYFPASTPGMVFTTLLTVVAPVGEEWTPDPHDVSVRAEVSSGNGTEVITRTYLKKTGRVSIFVKNDTIICNPGEMVKYPLSVQNLGNAEDIFGISIESMEESHWITLNSNYTDPVQPFELVEFYLSILVPTEGAPPYGSGKNFTIKAISNISGGKNGDSTILNVVVGIRRNSSIESSGDLQETILPGEMSSFHLVMTNTGNLPEELHVSMQKSVSVDGIFHNQRAKNWSVKSSVESKFLQIGESVYLVITINAPDNALMGEYCNVTIRGVPTLSSKGPEEFQGILISLIVGNHTEIIITPEDEQKSGGANETITHTLIIENHSNHNITLNSSTTTGLKVDVFVMGEKGLEYWLWLPMNFVIRAYSTSQIYLLTRIPPRTIVNTNYDITIAIEGYYHTSTRISLQVSQVYKIHLNFYDTSHKIIQGRNTNYTLGIENLGNGYDIVSLTVKNTVDYWRTSLQNTSISIGPFSKRFITINVITPSPHDYHGKPRESARFLINATSRGAWDETYTPYTYLSLLTVDPPSDPMDSYYTFDPNKSNDPHRVGLITGYCYKDRTITYEFTFMNLGEGNSTEFVIPDIFPPTYMDVSITNENGVRISGGFTAREYSAIPLYLHIRIDPLITPMNISNEPLLFSINSPSASSSIQIYTEILYLDLKFKKVDIPFEAIEGNKIDIVITVYASSGLYRTETGFEGIDSIRNLEITGFFDGDRIFSHTIPQLKIDDKEDITIKWRIPHLSWNEKERKEDFIIRIEGYTTYQGDVEQDTVNNQQRTEVVIRDASLTDQGNLDVVTSLSFLILLLSLEGFALTRFGSYHTRKKRTKNMFSLLFVLVFALMLGSMFNLPWHYVSGWGNIIGLILSYLILIIIFPVLIFYVARRTMSYPIVEVSALLLLPLYLVAGSLGAGREATMDSLSSTILLSGYGISSEFPVAYLIPLYLILGLVINYRIVRRYNIAKIFIQEIRKDLFRKSRRLGRKEYA